jgi:hypothetical protein
MPGGGGDRLPPSPWALKIDEKMHPTKSCWSVGWDLGNHDSPSIQPDGVYTVPL